MSNTGGEVDLLQIKIDQAKEKLPVETLQAIDAIDWKSVIISMREKRGYSFEQLGDLEIETELVLYGLTPIQDYPKEIQDRLKISKAETNELVEELNTLIFAKIKEELIKNTERKKTFQSSNTVDKKVLQVEGNVLEKAGINIVTPAPNSVSTTQNKTIETEKVVESREELLNKVENPEPVHAAEVHPLFAQKLSNTINIQTVKTAHTLDNLSRDETASSGQKSTEEGKKVEDKKKSGYDVDPYRMIPE